MPRLFDPLRYLLSMQVEPYLGPDGQGRLRFDHRHTKENREEALTVARRWRDVLVMQLESGGVSVQKLVVRGMVRVEELRERERAGG